MINTTQTANQNTLPIFPSQHTGPLSNREWRALQWLHDRAPAPLTMRVMMAAPCEFIEDDLFLGVSYLQARGWVRCKHTAWSFTSLGLREAPDRDTAMAVKLPPFVKRVARRTAMPIDAVTTARMAAVLVTLGDGALHEPDFGPQAQELDHRGYTALLEVCTHHGFDADDAMELSRLIHIGGGLNQDVYDLAMRACADVPPQAFLDALKPNDRDWLLTDHDLQSGAVH